MIGLNQDKIRAALVKHMGDRGVILDPEQPVNGIRFMGMGNKRKTTVFLPDERDMSDDEIASAVEALANDVAAGLRSNV